MKYLITGACGFIGTNLCKRLLELGHEVFIYDKADTFGKLTKFVDQIPRGLDLIEDYQRFGVDPFYYREDYTKVLNSFDYRKEEYPDQENIYPIIKPPILKVCEGMDVVIHLAAQSGVLSSIEDPEYDMNNNVGLTVSFLEAARKQRVKKFIFSSSGAVVGDADPPLHEEMLCKPISPYGVSKLSCENYCRAYHHTFGLDTITFRFSNVYGPYSKHKTSLVAKFINHALTSDEPFYIYGDGYQTRDFIYVDDIVNTLIKASESEIGGQVFQLATQQETNIINILNLMNDILADRINKRVDLVNIDPMGGEVRRNYADISKIKKYLNFSPSVDLKTGLGRTIDWFL